ncbi:Sugar phosphate isomerase/epimerase [Singulisphaera sp. GP187]|nr:Sugar phosphate isomerase/epimerase [Singulisphaera sp. GP187]
MTVPNGALVVSEFLYCLNTSTIRPTPLLEKIRIAGRLGYQALEPWNNEIDEYLRSGGTLPDLRNALADAGLKVVSVIALHGWVLAQGADYAKVKDDCRRRMEQAAALGSPSIVASPPQEEVDLDQAAARFGELLELGRQCGVTPSMEFLGFVAGVKNVASALAIATGSGDPRATVVADVFHMIRGGGSVDDLLALEGRQLACFHLNDLPASPDPLAQTDADRVMLGDGIADLPRVIANLRTIGFRGPLSLELFNPTLWGQDPFEVAKTGIERMKRLVER